MAHQDPFDWTIGEVIYQLCEASPSLWCSEFEIKTIPKISVLKDALEANDVDGECLLSLDDEQLKHDLDLKSLGQRRETSKIINYLRLQSVKYLGQKAARQPPSTPDHRPVKRQILEIRGDRSQSPASPLPKKRRIAPTLLQPLANEDPVSKSDPTLELDQYDRDFLERHAVENDDSETYPCYGESGSEGDFDDQLLAEMEEEARERQRIGQKTALTGEEVNAAIGRAIASLRQNWIDTKLPHKQRKAYRLWQSANETNSWQAQIEHCDRVIKTTQARILKYRSNIEKAHKWYEESEIAYQCQVLEASVEDCAEFEHYRGVLESDDSPAPPPQILRKPVDRSRHVLPEGEELIETDTDASSFISLDEDDQGDFMSEHSLSQVDSDETMSEVDDDNRSSSNELQGQDEEAADEQPEVTVKTPYRSVDAQALAESTQRNPLVLPPYTDSEDEIKDSKRKTPKYASTPSQSKKYIDLTLSSSPQKSTPAKKISLKLNLGPKPEGTSAVDRKQSWADVNTTSDRNLVLKEAMRSLGSDKTKAALKFVRKFDDPEAFDSKLNDMLFDSLVDGTFVKEISSEDQVAAHSIGKLYLQYACSCYLSSLGHPRKRKFKKAVRKASAELNQLAQSFRHAFVTIAGSTPSRNTPQRIGRPISELYQTPTKINQLRPLFDHPETIIRPLETDWSEPDVDDIGSTNSDSTRIDEAETKTAEGHNSAKKRKRKVIESTEAKARQKEDEVRVREQEARLKLMMQRAQNMAVANQDRIIPVNTEDPVVTLDRHIAARIKDHQIRGLQFIWRELIEDNKHQGSLLAHTMGLGKTMQVVSFLVTLAQCRSSDDEAVRNLLPAHLQDNRTLILCPASLLENWNDELLLWRPPSQPDLLGAIHMATMSKANKINSVQAWAARGGVLIISYETFRSLAKCEVEVGDEVQKLEDDLLKLPTLVVADEAHRMKNPKSGLNKLAREFQTMSRIALTGSPLNNHLEEYHTMIDWIAPNYLGSLVQFKAKYSEPISQGLYSDSSNFEHRTALRKLHILKRDIAAKINRADITAIADDMPQKTEFYITLPLSQLQNEAYKLLVDHILKNCRGNARGSRLQTKFFAWLSSLSLLCNHPACLIDVLQKRAEGLPIAPPLSAETQVDDEGQVPDEALTNSDELVPILPRLESLFRNKRLVPDGNGGEISEVEASVDDPGLSYRVQVAREILIKACEAKEKTLIFSQSIPTLNYLERMLRDIPCVYMRIDGSSRSDTRQAATKVFNDSEGDYQAFLISTRAGGLGLNLQGANRVIIFDFGFNPSWEEQAIGRAYRLGQKKPVFVYRFRAGGTFEDALHNKAVFKTQLFSRVVDQKNVARQASKEIEDFVFPPRHVEYKEFPEARGKDPAVLDRVLEELDGSICDVILTETFHREEDEEELTEQERKEAEEDLKIEMLTRVDPIAAAKAQARRTREEYERQIRHNQVMQQQAMQQQALQQQTLRQQHVARQLAASAGQNSAGVFFQTAWGPLQYNLHQQQQFSQNSSPDQTRDDVPRPVNCAAPPSPFAHGYNAFAGPRQNGATFIGSAPRYSSPVHHHTSDGNGTSPSQSDLTEKR